jgi:hypothetical protein
MRSETQNRYSSLKMLCKSSYELFLNSIFLNILQEVFAPLGVVRSVVELFGTCLALGYIPSTVSALQEVSTEVFSEDEVAASGKCRDL